MATYEGRDIQVDVPITPERAAVMQAVDQMDKRLGMSPSGNLQPQNLARLGSAALLEGAPAEVVNVELPR